MLEEGYRYCVDGNSSTTATATVSATSTASTTASGTGTGTGIVTPTPTQDGMVSECDTFYLVQDGDGCYNIAASYGITLDEFYEWNPAVDDCSQLWPDYYVW